MSLSASNRSCEQDSFQKASQNVHHASQAEVPSGGTTRNNANHATSPLSNLEVCPEKILKLAPLDEQFRLSKNSKGPAYCVDELCSCNLHKCVQLPKPRPFTAESHYRSEYYQKTIPSEFEGIKNYNSDGTNWESGLNGVPMYKPKPDNRDFSTETRSQFVTKQLEGTAEKVYGPTDLPWGIDPKVWKEFVSKNGPMPLSQIPQYLRFNSRPDTRDFATESRDQFKNKYISDSATVGKNGCPENVDPKIWQEYVDLVGDTANITDFLARYSYKSHPETRDFSTNYRCSYAAPESKQCQLNYLPQYPAVAWPRQHIFWDSVLKRWY
ncbi:uncharacterized protein LOC128884127 [Hylaeus volcanicus]|uniref:uncharacterized protein LOC128884127 n=1 Tax=Hylaeus volcanicus TaxID=313075 RepID=UPI0023B84875|nr:uncharacterized protein LOC128884127 [Hylaeus volcanicus]XP_053993188.1 uncharacterized protein LOC128884127 [Hylaeus volcanicus]